MHFENYFYGSIHFGLPEQVEAARDPNRLNYGSLNMMRPEEVRRQLAETYTPANIRSYVQEGVLDSKAEGAQAMREKLLDWLRAHVPPGFRPEDPQAERQEAWLFEQCHGEDFKLRDQALNFILCSMHILRPEGIVCLVGDPATAVAPTQRGAASPSRRGASMAAAAPARRGAVQDPAQGHAHGEADTVRRCVVQ